MDVISASLCLYHAQKKMRPAFKGPVWTEDHCRGRRAKEKTSSIARMFRFSRELVHPAKHRK